ncbi:putative glucan 1,3-beta-glucosidase [Helianthus annuus]|nr:putative glucan 1,3-beta-glucosidase [Helianthus annuus]KAJ0766683.1 putative glucan 1,3-beta-glucosidase [Helianthus annuus]
MVAEILVENLRGLNEMVVIYGIDAVHGHNNVYKATIFPHKESLDPVLIKKIGAATALEIRATGIQYAFAPCIAVSR